MLNSTESMITQTLKGFRDFLPKDARKRQYVINILKDVFESYGFEPLETPALEYEEILLGKYGNEGDKLMYRFEDRGKRKVAMRYDQTVPLARVVAQYQNDLPFPFKRYQIQNVWRAENPQKGRFREFIQCDIDSVGTQSINADSEVILCVADAFERLGLKKAKILVNDRRIFEGIDKKAITIIDKINKLGEYETKQLLRTNGFDETLIDILKNKDITPQLDEIIKHCRKYINFNYEVTYSPLLARGLDYYTGLIMEVELEDYKAGSLGGGGRYDNLIGMFTGKQIPAIGFAFGFDRIIDVMSQYKLFPETLQTTKVLITSFSSDLKEQIKEVEYIFRQNGINTELYLDENARMEKQLKYADKKNIPYVVIIGPAEIEKRLIILKNMISGEQKTVTVNEAVAILNT